MKLQAGQAWNHNGTFIEGLGVQYHQHKIIVSVNAHDVLAGMSRTQDKTTILLFPATEICVPTERDDLMKWHVPLRCQSDSSFLACK